MSALEDVIVRLKPLNDASAKAGPLSLFGDGKQEILAHSWIGKPSSAMDEEAGKGAGFEDEAFYGREWWDCDGCPPPYFDLPPPPKPPFLDETPCEEVVDAVDGSAVLRPVSSPYEVCDNPVIIDSRLHFENDLLNILVIVISAVVLVFLILLGACIVWRKRLCRLSSSSNTSSLSGREVKSSRQRANEFDLSSPTSSSTTSNRRQAHAAALQHHLDRQQQQQRKKCDENNFPSHFLPPILQSSSSSARRRRNSIELKENPPSHVYSNPNYPTLEIGGLPFYLMPANTSTSASSSSPPASSERELNMESRFSSQQPHAAAAATLGPSRQQNGFYEAGYEGGGSTSTGGPIYEDIDRMCTYRGSPPEMSNAPRLPPPGLHHQHQHQMQQQPIVEVNPGDNRTYYNVFTSPKMRPDSAESSSSPQPNNCGTSSSEVSFDSSPRHIAGSGVIVNPMNRFRGSGGGSNTTSPSRHQPQPQPRSSSRGQISSPSVYYYSDTLRPRQNRAFILDSDSGISNSNVASNATPPPLPSSRMAAAAAEFAASPSSSSGSSGRGGRTAAAKDGGRRKAAKTVKV